VKETGLSGLVASYAWGDDYHDVLPERLQQLVSFIENHVGHPVTNRWYTDTGPILERDLAQRAGLGWIGKNTCLIHPRLGSYFLLAEILLGVELEADAPFVPDHCGTCRRCLEACPTGCILENRTLDANRCISYLTIELKETIPVGLRSKIGEWLFGCDICQQVCPWNQRFATSAGDQAFNPRPNLPHPKLLQEIGLSQHAFNRKFKGNPIKRGKRRGYLRNVAVALGNIGESSVVPALVEALANDPEPLVRGHAAWALGTIGGEAAWRGLRASSQREKAPAVLDEIRDALAHIEVDSNTGV
jgi:epoxyqueuosine reductase